MHVNPTKVVPITELQARASQLLAEVKQTGEPVLITLRGRSAAVLINVDEYDSLLKALEDYEARELDFLIAAGERARKQGKVITQAEVKRRLGYRGPKYGRG